MANIVILSPHLDDAVFNCWWGLQQPDTTVLNVFAGMPPTGTKRFWDIVCGEPDGCKMVTKRRQENEAAVNLSGQSNQQVYLDHLDAQYRNKPIGINQLANDIVANAPQGSVFLAPLAASRLRQHSDHVLVRKAAQQLIELGHTIYFYPDAPYMQLPAKADERKLARMASLAANVLGTDVKHSVRRLSAEQLSGKISAMRAYESQYTMTNLFSFGGLSRIAKRDYEVVFEPLDLS